MTTATTETTIGLIPEDQIVDQLVHAAALAGITVGELTGALGTPGPNAWTAIATLACGLHHRTICDEVIERLAEQEDSRDRILSDVSTLIGRKVGRFDELTGQETEALCRAWCPPPRDDLVKTID
jgi:hypothetical protein